MVSFRSTNASQRLTLEEKLIQFNMTRQLVVYLEDVRLNKNFDADGVTFNEDRKKTYTCYVCMAKFASTLNLNKHKALHGDSELEDDIFEEETLHKMSTTKNIPNGGQENEARSESSDKPKCVVTEQTQMVRTSFRCDPCDVFFEGSDDAKLHKITNKCKFACRICNRKFNTLYAFVVHIMQHKSNSSKSNKPSQMVYTCTTCKMSFHNCLLLRSHEINTHNQKSDSSQNVDAVVNNGESKHSEQSDDPSRIPGVAVNNAESTQSEQSDNPLNPDDAVNNGENTHSQQSGNTLRISEAPVNAPSEEANATIKTEPIELPIHDQFQNFNITTNEPEEICCELCYDVFKSEEELKSHMEFHEQLENSSQTIVIEDDEDVVEVYEEKKDPHEIITTIKSRPPQKKVEKTYVGPNLTIPTISPKATSNQKLTAAIKDMLTPRDEKQPKTVLTPQMPNLISVSQIRQKPIENATHSVANPTNASNVELRKTGPFSYALHFKGNDTSSPGASPSPKTTETSNVNLKASNANLQSTFPQYGPALVNSNQFASGVTGNVMNNPNLQFAITGIPHVSEVQVTPWSNPTINAFNNVKQNTSALPTISIATTSANNITYVMSPTTRFASPIVVNDPQKKLAYVILPHANNDVVNSSSAVTNVKPIMLATNARAVITPELSKQLSISPTGKTSQSSTVAATASATSTKENSLPDPSSTLKDTGMSIPTTTGASTSGATTSQSDAHEPSFQKYVIESIVIDSDSSNDGTPKESNKKINTTNESEMDELIIDESSSTTEQLPENESLESDLRNDEKSSKKKWKFPMKCDGCLVVFQRLRSMRHHLERRRRCQLCPFRCCKVSDFKQHYILEHRKFFCSRCSYLADTKTAFTEHNRRTHICHTCNGFYFNLMYHTCHKLAENIEKISDENGESADGKA